LEDYIGCAALIRPVYPVKYFWSSASSISPGFCLKVFTELFSLYISFTSDALRLSDLRGSSVIGYDIGLEQHCRSDKAPGRHPTWTTHLFGNYAGIASDGAALDLRNTPNSLNCPPFSFIFYPLSFTLVSCLSPILIEYLAGDRHNIHSCSTYYAWWLLLWVCCCWAT